MSCRIGDVTKGDRGRKEQKRDDGALTVFTDGISFVESVGTMEWNVQKRMRSKVVPRS